MRVDDVAGCIRVSLLCDAGGGEIHVAGMREHFFIVVLFIHFRRAHLGFLSS